MVKKCLLLVALALLVAGCGGTPVPTAAPAVTSVPPTRTAVPPTRTAVPPTETPLPTRAPRPTDTPSAGPAYNPTFGLTPTYEARVDVDGTNLYVVCFGAGTPTVVFDSGWNDAHTQWVDTVHELYTHTRVCAYDRPGVSLSGGTPRARSAQELADLLHGMLVKAQIPGPYVIVGHSIAALLDVVFASTYPQDTAGLVLIDGSCPDMCQHMRDVLPPESPDDSADLRDLRSTLVDCDTWWSTATSGGDDRWLAVAGEQAAAVTSLGALPLVVLLSIRDPESWGDLPPDLIAQLEQLRIDLHQEYADLSTNGSLVLVKDTGHYIYLDQPQVVVDTILEVLEMARGR